MVRSSDHDQITVSWLRPVRLNGVLKKFVIKCSDEEGDEIVGELTRDLTNTTFYYTLRPLKEMTKYSIQVVVHTHNFYSESPRKILVETLREPTPSGTINLTNIRGGVF